MSKRKCNVRVTFNKKFYFSIALIYSIIGFGLIFYIGSVNNDDVYNNICGYGIEVIDTSLNTTKCICHKLHDSNKSGACTIEKKIKIKAILIQIFFGFITFGFIYLEQFVWFTIQLTLITCLILLLFHKSIIYQKYNTKNVKFILNYIIQILISSIFVIWIANIGMIHIGRMKYRNFSLY